MNRAARFFLVLLLSTLLLPSIPAGADSTFADGFESGDLSAWTFSSGLIAQQAVVGGGSWAARGTGVGTATYAYSQLVSAQADLTASVNVYVVSRGSAVTFLSFRTATGGILLSIFANARGNVAMTNKITKVTTSTTVPVTMGTWHLIKAHLVVRGSTSLIEFWLDGVMVAPLSKTDNLGGQPVGRFYLGETSTGRTYDIAFDDVAVGSVDATPPSVPTSVNAAAAGPTEVEVRWDPAMDDVGVTGYDVFRDDAPIGTVSGTVLRDPMVAPLSTYGYTVVAFDAAGHRSATSAPALVTTPEFADAAPPSAPADLDAHAISTNEIDLSWQASVDDLGVSAYTIYRDGAPLVTLSGARTSYRDVSVAPSISYVYEAEAMDGAGNASIRSTSATATGIAPTPGGVFSIHCLFSHQAPDDPIVDPGIEGATHLHQFFGSNTTNAQSTYDSMISSTTSCKLSTDTAGYWAPALLAPDGSVVEPVSFTAYYRALPPGGTFVAPPPDLRLIAGYPTTQTGTAKKLGYSCQDTEPLSATPIDCTGHAALYLIANIFFPNCWDGMSTDSADHRSHVVYPVSGVCPAGHPVKLPRLSIHIHYPVTDARGYYLSSDAEKGVTDGRSLHADLWNTWNQSILERLVAVCVNGATSCLDRVDSTVP